MAVPIDIINSLKSLPCFTEIQAISLVTSGLSQTAIKVTTTAKVFFAKKLNEETVHTETSCALFCARGASGQGPIRQLSPDVIYHDQQWLVTDYICGDTLADSKTGSEVKIKTALNLMAKLHQLSTADMKEPIATLDPNLSAERLLVNPVPLIAHNLHILNNVIKSLTLTINHLIGYSTTPSVFCHGDLNFTNILEDNEQQPWLIDFECSHIAPIEFDLAMFIAVNNIPTQQLNEVAEYYTKLSPQYRCNTALLKHYLLYSFFINGLWYFDNNNSEEHSEGLFQKLALEQWSAFDSFADEHALEIPKLMPLLS